MRNPVTARVLAVPTVAVLALGLLAGCGGSGGKDSGVASVSGGKSSASSDGGGGSKSNAAQAQQFVDCMRNNGVDMDDPDPKTGQLDLQSLKGTGGGADMQKLNKAMTACRDKAPQQLRKKADTKPDPEQLQKFVDCMRKNGVDLNDPGPDGLDDNDLSKAQADPDFQKATSACRDYLTAAMGGGK